MIDYFGMCSKSKTVVDKKTLFWRGKLEIYEPISWWIVFGFAWGTRQVNQLMNIGFWLDSFIGENRTISSLTVEGKNKSTKRPPFSFWMLCLLLKVRAGIFIYFLSSLKVVWRSYYLTVVPYPIYIVQFFNSFCQILSSHKTTLGTIMHLKTVPFEKLFIYYFLC